MSLVAQHNYAQKRIPESYLCNASVSFRVSGRAKGAAKGSCGETVVQKGVFGESVSSLLP